MNSRGLFGRWSKGLILAGLLASVVVLFATRANQGQAPLAGRGQAAPVPYDGRNLVPPPLPPIGDFESQSDIGTGLMPGFAAFDMARHEYTVIGSGDDIYGTTDAFHFLWRKISSDDMALSASVALVGSSGINNRQAGLMIRQGLAQDDAYAGVMIHGTGQIVVKFRPSGGVKSTIQSVADQTMPQSMRVELHGKTFSLFLAAADQQFKPAGTAVVNFSGPVYAGLFVCSHNGKALQTAIFSNVRMVTSPSAAPSN